MEEDVGMQNGHTVKWSVTEEFLICSTKAETKMNSLIVPGLLARVGSNSRQHALWVN